MNILKRRFTPSGVRHIVRYERVLGTSFELQVLKLDADV